MHWHRLARFSRTLRITSSAIARLSYPLRPNLARIPLRCNRSKTKVTLMTLSNLKSWIREAQRKQFAIGAFNANTMEQVQAIVLAAEAEQAPVIIQVSHHALEYAGNGNPTLGLRYMAEIGKVAAESVSVPVALHLDHGTESEVMQAIALGFTSV